MKTIAGSGEKTSRDILSHPNRVLKPSSHHAHEFSVTGNRNSIHMRDPKDQLFETNELLSKKREEKNQSEFWIG